MFDATWLQSAAGAFDASLLPEKPVTIALTILGGPEGDIPTIWRCNEGLHAEVGEDPDADVSLSIPWKDAAAVVRGELAPAVAYMQGKLKGSGDMTLLLDMMKENASPTFNT